MEKEQWVFFFLMCASVAAAFLAYTIAYRKERQMNWKHPRILVEMFLSVLFLLIAGLINMQ